MGWFKNLSVALVFLALSLLLQSCASFKKESLCGGWGSTTNSKIYTFLYTNGMAELDSSGGRAIREYHVNTSGMLSVKDGSRWEDWIHILELRDNEMLFEYPMQETKGNLIREPNRWVRLEACRPFDGKLHPVPKQKTRVR
jgi:hypothetical protein